MNTILRSLVRSIPVLSLLLIAPLAYADINFGGSITITFGSGGGTIQGVLATVLTIINGYLVPIIFAIAFIVFLWGLFTYFIQGGADEEKRKNGRQLVIWGLIGFAVMFSLWGLVQILLTTFGLNASSRPCIPTAIPGFCV